MNKKKTAPKKRKYTKQNGQYWRKTSSPRESRDEHIANLKPFEIEKEPPHYRHNPDLINTLNRITATIKIINPGEAFIVPSKSKGAIKAFLAENWPSMAFRFSTIKDNPSMMRIYYLKH